MNDIQHGSKGAVARTTATPEDIVGKELVTYDIASDGSRFRMSFVCTDRARVVQEVVNIKREARLPVTVPSRE